MTVSMRVHSIGSGANNTKGVSENSTFFSTSLKKDRLFWCFAIVTFPEQVDMRHPTEWSSGNLSLALCASPHALWFTWKGHTALRVQPWCFGPSPGPVI